VHSWSHLDYARVPSIGDERVAVRLSAWERGTLNYDR
jgi:hypothetical protein